MKTIAITGVLGYSGRYVAVRRGWRVIGLTQSAGRLPNPKDYELRPMPWSDRGDGVLEGVDVIVNTYWVRFSHRGPGHAEFSHGQAVKNTRLLFHAANRAGVKRVIHTSITNPDPDSALPYFRGKAELEKALIASGVPHSILRPAVFFGETPAESILMNNMAWCLRHFPCVCTFGWGNYELQPIHVQDFAQLALDEAERGEASRVIHAVGSETYSFRTLWQLLVRAMGVYRAILPVPSCLGYAAAQLIGSFWNDVMLTRDEITGLCEGRLSIPTPPSGRRSLRDWVRRYASELGLSYQSELARRA